MKAAEAKHTTSSHAHNSRIPFFQKNGEGAFFSDVQADIQTKPFFSKQKTSPLIQTKLTIGRPGDRYEQEADAMADRVVQRLSNPEILQGNPVTSLTDGFTPLVQPKCAACEEEKQVQKKEEEEERWEHGIQRKPVFESGQLPSGEEIQRKCAECEAEEKLQKKGAPYVSENDSPSSLESRLNASRGSGSPLPEGTRTQMESSFGADFSNVRIHTGSSAVQMNQELHARAFTHGSDIYFNSGKYNPESTEGKHLLAHELTHTVQQGGMLKPVVVQRSCGVEEIGKPAGCEPVAGDLGGPRYLFRVNCDIFARGNDLDLEKDAEKIQDGATIDIHGFASVEGNHDYNINLSCARAIAAKKLVESVLSKQRVSATIRIFSHGPQQGNRTTMRSVIVLIQNPAPRPELTCPPAKGFQATSLYDYVDLIKCVESSTNLTNRQVLALLRQMYYGKSWSATSKTELWDNVITCNINPGDPQKLLHPDLFEALHRSVDVQGVDIGHVFTGLESMMCPSFKVKIDDTFLVSGIMDDIANVEMSNEEFSTWGGDLGAAVAAMASCWFMDENQRKKTKDCEGADLMKGLLTFLEIHAPDQDLEGDIISFVLRANANGIACPGSSGKQMNLSAPISELFVRFLTDKKSGSGYIDRYSCFASIIGATVVNGQIQNKREIVSRFIHPVSEFAKTYYVKIMKEVHGALPPHRIVPFGISMDSINRNTPLAIRYFLAWLERKMSAGP